MSVRKQNRNAVLGDIAQAANGVSGEALLSLLAIRHDGRARGFEPRNGILHSGFVVRLQLCLRHASGLEGARRFNEGQGPWNASDRFSRNCHG